MHGKDLWDLKHLQFYFFSEWLSKQTLRLSPLKIFKVWFAFSGFSNMKFSVEELTGKRRNQRSHMTDNANLSTSTITNLSLQWRECVQLLLGITYTQTNRTELFGKTSPPIRNEKWVTSTILVRVVNFTQEWCKLLKQNFTSLGMYENTDYQLPLFLTRYL